MKEKVVKSSTTKFRPRSFNKIGTAILAWWWMKSMPTNSTLYSGGIVHVMFLIHHYRYHYVGLPCFWHSVVLADLRIPFLWVEVPEGTVWIISVHAHRKIIIRNELVPNRTSVYRFHRNCHFKRNRLSVVENNRSVGFPPPVLITHDNTHTQHNKSEQNSSYYGKICTNTRFTAQFLFLRLKYKVVNPSFIHDGKSKQSFSLLWKNIDKCSNEISSRHCYCSIVSKCSTYLEHNFKLIKITSICDL